jgi:peptide/nickel transport system permease protein
MTARGPLLAGGCIVATLLACALISLFLSPLGRLATENMLPLSPPSWDHVLGTDAKAHDMFALLLVGTRTALQIAVVAVALPLLVGTLLGGLAGWFGGATDAVIGGVMELISSFPYLVLVIAFIAVLGPGLGSLYITVAYIGWVAYARLIRDQMRALKQAGYVTAGWGLGYSVWRIALLHILPNALRPALVNATADMGGAIVLAATLGALGLGTQPPVVEWGWLVQQGGKTFIAAPWISMAPGVAVMVAALGFSLLSDGLRGAKP